MPSRRYLMDFERHRGVCRGSRRDRSITESHWIFDFSPCLSYAVEQVDWLSDDRNHLVKKMWKFSSRAASFSFLSVAGDEKVFRVWWAWGERRIRKVLIACECIISVLISLYFLFHQDGGGYSEREAPFTAKYSFIRPCPIPGEFQLTFPLGSWTLLQFRCTTNEKKDLWTDGSVTERGKNFKSFECRMQMPRNFFIRWECNWK